MRKIDEKHHIDNNQIIKTTNGTIISEDEPTILFRGRDYLAVSMLEFYKQLCKNDGATDYQLGSMEVMIEKFRNFAKNNPKIMKQPGITKGL